MESINPECTEAKKAYEACFNVWYAEKYLKGDTIDECGPLFRQYRACIESTLKGKRIDALLDEHHRIVTASSEAHEGGEAAPPAADAGRPPAQQHGQSERQT